MSRRLHRHNAALLLSAADSDVGITLVELTGVPVDVLTDDVRGDPHFEHVLAEAVPL